MKLHPTQWHFSLDKWVNPWLPTPPWSRVPYCISHFLGHRRKPQPSLGNIVMIFWTFIGVFVGLTTIELVGREIPAFRDHGAPLIIGSFGAAAVLEFYAIESPLAQPRNAILGQVFACIIGVTIRKIFSLNSSADSPTSTSSLTWLAGSLSCACATSFMALTGTVHPPAGATALLAVVDNNVAHLGWFLIPVVLLGCTLMQVVALLINNIQRRFPLYWWTPEEVGQRWKTRDVKSFSEPESSGRSSGEIDIPRHMEEGKDRKVEGSEEPQLVIRRGHLHIPHGMYLRPEEKLLLEALSERF